MRNYTDDMVRPRPLHGLSGESTAHEHPRSALLVDLPRFSGYPWGFCQTEANTSEDPRPSLHFGAWKTRRSKHKAPAAGSVANGRVEHRCQKDSSNRRDLRSSCPVLSSGTKHCRNAPAHRQISSERGELATSARPLRSTSGQQATRARSASPLTGGYHGRMSTRKFTELCNLVHTCFGPSSSLASWRASHQVQTSSSEPPDKSENSIVLLSSLHNEGGEHRSTHTLASRSGRAEKGNFALPVVPAPSRAQRAGGVSTRALSCFHAAPFRPWN